MKNLIDALGLLTLQGYVAVRKERMIEMIEGDKFLDLVEKEKEFELFAVIRKIGEDYEIENNLRVKLVPIMAQVKDGYWITAIGSRRFLEKKDGSEKKEIWEHVEVLGKELRNTEGKDGFIFSGKIRQDLQKEIINYLKDESIVGVFVQRPEQKFDISQFWKNQIRAQE